MRKTSVYLTDEEAQGLRRAAIARGKSQSELIREAVREITAKAPARKFHSMGVGRGPGGPTPLEWDTDDLYRSVMGREP